MKPSSLHLRMLAAAAAVALASGCATRLPVPTSGNLAAATPDVEIALANEAGDFLRGTYPPASTEFGIAQAVDPFSKRLKSVLRRSGYAVAAAPMVSAQPSSDSSALPLNYWIDQPLQGLFRVVLVVGPTTATRAFFVRAGRVSAAGAWTRRVKDGEALPPEYTPVTTPSVLAYVGEPEMNDFLPPPPETEVASAVKSSPAGNVAAAAANPLSPSAEAPTSWTVGGERTLRDIFTSWTTAAGVRLQWEAARDVPAAAEMRGTYSGSLKDALIQLAGKSGGLDVPMGIRFLEGGKALRVYDLAVVAQ